VQARQAISRLHGPKASLTAYGCVPWRALCRGGAGIRRIDLDNEIALR
jgi:hypothetical protein